MDLPRKELSVVDLLLARIFLKEADAELLRELARPEVAEVFEQFQPGFNAYVRDREWSDSALHELATEYGRLFLLPEGVSPYAVKWMQGEEGAVKARLEDQISILYESLRVQPMDFGLGNVPADHVGMLLALTSVALETEPTPKVGGLASRSQALIADWAPQFSDALLEKTENPLYRAAAKLLPEVLALPPED